MEFDAAIASIEAGLAAGTWSGDPATVALAMSTLSDAQSMRDDLHAVLLEPETQSALVPVTGSSAGTSLLNRLAELQSRIGTGLSIPGFSTQPALAAAVPTTADWDRFLTSGAGPVAGALDAPIFMALGDVEIGAAYLLVSGAAAQPGGLSVRSAIHGKYRMPTSRLDDANRFFDLGTGDRQADVEVAVVTDLARGRAAVRLTGWHTRQLAGTQERRIGPPTQPIQFRSTLATVERDPGDVFGVGVLPAYRFTEALAFVAGMEWWTRGDDSYRYADGQPALAGLDPQVLGIESGATALTFRFGLTFAHPSDRGTGMPLDASVLWERVVSAAGGRVPKAETVRAMLRIYGRVW
jgi:hypothetical protein